MDSTALATLWATVGLLIFLGIVIYLKAPALVAKSLDGRAESIRKELASAKQLRDEAQALLKEYQKKRKEAESEAAEIIASAQREADILGAEARQKSEDYLARRVAQSEQKIKRAESEAIKAVRSVAVDLAMGAAEALIIDKLDDKINTDLFNKSVNDVKTRLM